MNSKGQNGTLFPDWKKHIAGREVPIVILGDPAYPLLPWLMKAFPDNGRLTQQQKTFNFRLSSTRVVVEHAYGRLKGRWRCLLKRFDISILDVPIVVAACCVLHNLCETNDDNFDEDWLEDDDNCNAGGRDCTSASSETGQATRDVLMSYFREE